MRPGNMLLAVKIGERRSLFAAGVLVDVGRAESLSDNVPLESGGTNGYVTN